MKGLAIAAVAAMAVAFAPAAHAQGGGSASACFEVIAARPNVEPPVPIMIDKCSGRSWVLIRNGKSYRWSLISTEMEKPKISDRAPMEGAAPAPESGSQKCFTFNGRKFCE
jgi:hypothetical protein